MERDVVFLQGLELDVQIGFHEVELAIKQTVLVDFSIEADFRVGPERDSHEGLVDYYEIARQIEARVAGRCYQLVEALAVDIAEVVLRMHPTVKARVRVTKSPLDMKRTRAVGVECVRTAADFSPETPRGGAAPVA